METWDFSLWRSTVNHLETNNHPAKLNRFPPVTTKEFFAASGTKQDAQRPPLPDGSKFMLAIVMFPVLVSMTSTLLLILLAAVPVLPPPTM